MLVPVVKKVKFAPKTPAIGGSLHRLQEVWHLAIATRRRCAHREFLPDGSSTHQDPGPDLACRAAVGNIPNRDVAEIARIVSNLVRVTHTPAAASVPVATNDIASQLERLAALMDKGVLTPAEFAAQKAKLLS